MIHIISPVCMQDKMHIGYSSYLDHVQTNVRHGNSTKAFPNSRYMITNSHLRPLQRIYNLVCHGMSLIHWVRPMCTGGKDTSWIIAASWSPQSLVSVHHMHSHGYIDAEWTHFKWPGVV